MPVVTLNRVVIVAAISVAVALQQPLVLAALLLVLLPATLFGRRASLLFKLGSLLFAEQNRTAHREDFRMQRFNNTIATLMLAFALLGFALGLPVLGWAFAALVALAATAALLGFCVGCFLYLHLKLQSRRLFAWLN